MIYIALRLRRECVSADNCQIDLIFHPLREVVVKKALIFISPLFIFFIIAGCGKEAVVINQPDEENPGVFKDNTTASNHHLQQAKMFYARDKYKQALQHCEKAIEFDKHNWEAYFYMGMSMQKRKEYARSIEILNDGLKYSPDNKLVKAELHCAIGYSWENLGRYDEARRQYNLALDYNPNSEQARKGKNRIKVEKTMEDWSKDKEIKHEG
jgi:tetratricopeptide (TPR) repeat protein